MGYSVKWVKDNLGITRDMLRYYEKEKLLPENTNSKYRDFSDEDIKRIWNIKLLIGVGFTAREIFSIMNDPDFDFDAAMTQKVKELEQKHNEALVNLEYAKSIKLMGRIPTATAVGTIRFDEFLQYAHENWNFCSDPHSAPFMQMSETLTSKEPGEWSPEDVERMMSIFEDTETMMHAFALHGYYQVISDMRELGYSSETVQRVVVLLHRYLVEHNTEPDLDGKITPQFLAKYMAPFFMSGDVSIQYERSYGKEGCLFIAQALAYYGGYDINDL